MTQIIYLKCQDAQIIISDRKQTDGIIGEITKKYYLSNNREFVLALAGDGARIEQIFSNLTSDQNITTNIARDKVIEAIERSPNFSGETRMMSSGLLMTKENQSYKFHNVQFSNSTQYIIDDNPRFKCYGSGTVLANYLIRKFFPYNHDWKKALQYLIAIMNEIAANVDSVGSLDEYGFDIILILNDGEMKVCTLDSSSVSSITVNFTPDDSMIFECLETSELLESIAEQQPVFESLTIAPPTKTQIKQIPKKSTYNIDFQNIKYSVNYEVTNANILKMSFSLATRSIVIFLDTHGDGKLSVTLPRKLLDAKHIESGSYNDDQFIILADGEEAEFDEITTQTERTLIIQFCHETSEIEIMGTHHPVIVRTDNGRYTFGNKMIITVINPHLDLGKSIDLEILDEVNNSIYEKLILVDEKANDHYQEIIPIHGRKWNPDSDYTIIAKYGDQVASTKIHIVGFGMMLELDQKIYTWTDKVYIVLVAPDLNLNSKKVETVGYKDEYAVTLKTSKGEMNYTLQESGEDTGIFVGEITLTGFVFDKLKKLGLPKGTIHGNGPNSGFLSVANNDFLHVSVKTPTKTISADALVRWNIGEIQWLNAAYLPSDEAVVRVVDPDMNLDPDTIDEIEIDVWSDSDAKGIKLKLKETDVATGIFMGKVRFSLTEESHDDILRVSMGDTITAVYVDVTLPDPYSLNDELSVTATAFIGETLPRLQRLVSSQPSVFDAYGNELVGADVGQELIIASTLTNNQNKEQKFAYLVAIRDQNGNQEGLLHTNGSILPEETSHPVIKWKPLKAGKFTITTFVWESIDNPTALVPPMNSEIEIIGKELKYESKLNPHSHLFPQRHTISIPLGSSTPGCEVMNKCFIPSELIVRVNQIVIWKNDDVAAHTITSGDPVRGHNYIFDSNLINSGKSFAFNFKEKGVYEYYCLVHPWQKGKIMVE